MIRYESREVPGVRYTIRRVSLAQRIELVKSVRELCLKHEFLKAGDTADHMESWLADLLVRKLYLEWGLAEISGLRIDGKAATAADLIAKGPEKLSDEIIESIKSEIGLTEDERKNS
ncbi:MAG: hypothetical protein M3Y57_15130 [Acidobacteriota bacterium]|nr:hypothetical protein [Acidobacteriota bacterium]